MTVPGTKVYFVTTMCKSRKVRLGVRDLTLTPLISYDIIAPVTGMLDITCVFPPLYAVKFFVQFVGDRVSGSIFCRALAKFVLD